MKTLLAILAATSACATQVDDGSTWIDADSGPQTLRLHDGDRFAFDTGPGPIELAAITFSDGTFSTVATPIVQPVLDEVGSVELTANRTSEGWDLHAEPLLADGVAALRPRCIEWSSYDVAYTGPDGESLGFVRIWFCKSYN